MTAYPKTLDAGTGAAALTTSETGDVTVEGTLEPALRRQIAEVGLPALIAERTRADWQRVLARLADPTAADSRANYAAWLRRQARAWTGVQLPAVHVAALDWPLASVRPQCLDVVGLIIADLRDLSPRNRPSVVPAQPNRHDGPAHGTVVAAAMLCLRVAEQSAGLLSRAEALAAGTTALGTATRYLSRCADLAERSAGFGREVQDWAARVEDHELAHAVVSAQRFTGRLADALEAATRTGW